VTKEELAARLLATFAEELDDQVRQGNDDLLALERSPADLEQVRSLFRVMHTLKGAARAAGVERVERLCHQLEARLADLRNGVRAVSTEDVAALFAGLDELSTVAASMQITKERPVPASEMPPKSARTDRRHEPLIEPRAEAPVPARETTVRVAPERLDQLLAGTTQLLITSAAQADHGAALIDVGDLAVVAGAAARRVRRSVDQTGGVNPRTAADLTSIAEALDTIRLRTSRLAADVTRVAGAVGRHARELSLGVRDIRLRPFSDAVSALPRIVRDVALTTGKNVRLEVHGESVQADRGVLDEVQNALLHLVRNAIDHGIEAPGVRRRRGKAEEGVVRVSASLIGDRISVTVADDGGGIDIAHLRRILSERGEVVPDDDIGVARRLFSGGVTTRTAAGAISGRAVGLDAARAAMERVRGSLDVRWASGKSTTFTLEAPLSMSTVRTVLARVGTVSVAVPTAYVVRLLRTPASTVRSVNGRAALVSANDVPIPLVSLAALMGPPLVARAAAADETIVAIHIRANDVSLALRVDELIAEEELVVRPVRAQGRGAAPHVSGAALLSTGVIALVLNVPQLLASGAAAADAMPVDIVAPAHTARRHRILVVDDSITTRTLEASVLEAAGFEVTTAVDGADAWRLLEERGADLVVSDVEMPRMDGVQLCEAMRKSSRFKVTPVILVTALETAEDRSRGLEAGADAYLAKSSFDQEGLLDTVHQLIG
jgi:two-component system chemotaxis sensor kinase CheA